MKQYDKNSLIGFVLMAIILIVFNTFFFPDPLVDEKNTIPLTEEDTYIIEKKDTEAIIQIPTSINKSAISEELKLTYGVFANTAIGEEEYEVLENDKLKITISNKGGRIKYVILKEYQTYHSIP